MFTFIELPPFSALRDELFADDEFSALQGYLAAKLVEEAQGGLRWQAELRN